MNSKIIQPRVVITLLVLPHLWTLLLFCFVWFYYQGFSKIFIVISIIVPVSYISVLVYLDKRNLENTKYSLDDEKIDFIDGFLNKQKRTIQYSNITDVASEQKLFQRFLGIGRIGISTAGSIGYEMILENLENHEEIYEFLQSKISK